MDGLIPRLIAQTCRQSGLSVVYTEAVQFQWHGHPLSQGGKPGRHPLRPGVVPLPDATLIGLPVHGWAGPDQPADGDHESSRRPVITIASGDAALHPPAATDYDVEPAAIRDELSAAPPLERLLILVRTAAAR